MSRKVERSTAVTDTVQRTLAEHQREVLLVALLFASAFVVVSLLGFSELDGTVLHPDVRGTPVSNPCGPLGANLADLLYLGFGWGAWIVLLGMVMPVFALAGRPLGPLWRWAMGAWVWCLGLGLLDLALAPEGVVAWRPGGWLGAAITGALIDVVGRVGAWLALLAAFVSTSSVLAEVSWRELAWWLVDRGEAAMPHLRRGARSAGEAAGAHAAVMARALGRTSWAVLDALGAWARRRTWAFCCAAWRWLGGFRVRSWGTLRRMWGSFAGEGASREETNWRELTGLEALTPSDADVGALIDLAVPCTPAEGRRTDAPTMVAAVGAVAEVAWEPTRAEDRATLMGRFPSLGRRPSALPTPPPTPAETPVVAADRTVTGEVTSPSDFGRRRLLAAARGEAQTDPGDDAGRRATPSPPAPQVSSPAVVRQAFVAEAEEVDEEDAEDDDWEEEDSLPGLRGAEGAVRANFGPQVAAGEGLDLQVDDDGGAVADRGNLFFELPHLSLLDPVPEQRADIDEEALKRLAVTVEASLASFKVTGKVTNVRVGPVVTTFEFLPDVGISVRRIHVLQDDLAMALRAVSVRVVAPIPGKGVVGIEIPSRLRMSIYLRELLASEEFRGFHAALPVILGKDVEGRPLVADLARMPHLLVGGTTGSGKSVGVNGMLMSLLYTRTPEELRLLLVDPKKLEFESYADVPHLLHPVVTEPKAAAAALAWACREMDRRYELLARWGTRNISNYNKKVERETRSWSRDKARHYAPRDWPDDVPPPRPELLPYIVIVIDELADLMMTARKEVEGSVVRLAQMARACGMHLLVATQRPSVDVITGLIKSNLPTRISFKLRTVIDSRTILDAGGAEKLLGQGDMLYLPGAGDMQRAHGAFVSDDEVTRVIDFLKAQRAPDYIEAITAEEGEEEQMADPEDQDDLYEEAVRIVLKQGKASTSMVQRHLKIGYNRAARIIDLMEAAGLVGPADGARPREVLGSHGLG